MRTLLLAVGLTTACGSAEDVKFGSVTDGEKQAFHDWCKGDLEMESHMEVGKLSVVEGPNLLIMHCVNSGSDERGWIAFDSVTSELLNVQLDLSRSDFDRILNQTVVPSLDAEQKAAYDDLHATLANATGTATKSWDKGKAFMDVTAIDVTVPGSDPIWEFMLGHKKEKKKE